MTRDSSPPLRRSRLTARPKEFGCFRRGLEDLPCSVKSSQVLGKGFFTAREELRLKTSRHPSPVVSRPLERTVVWDGFWFQTKVGKGRGNQQRLKNPSNPTLFPFSTPQLMGPMTNGHWLPLLLGTERSDWPGLRPVFLRVRSTAKTVRCFREPSERLHQDSTPEKNLGKSEDQLPPPIDLTPPPRIDQSGALFWHLHVLKMVFLTELPLIIYILVTSSPTVYVYGLNLPLQLPSLFGAVDGAAAPSRASTNPRSMVTGTLGRRSELRRTCTTCCHMHATRSSRVIKGLPWEDNKGSPHHNHRRARSAWCAGLARSEAKGSGGREALRSSSSWEWLARPKPRRSGFPAAVGGCSSSFFSAEGGWGRRGPTRGNRGMRICPGARWCEKNGYMDQDLATRGINMWIGS